MISNQSGVARGVFAEEALGPVRDRVRDLIANIGVELDGFYYCPHHPEGNVAEYARACDCRKPAPGLLRRAAADLRVDCGTSWMIGDILDDVEAGRAAGCRTVLLDNGHETEWVRSLAREPDAIAPDLAAATRIILQAAAFRPCSVAKREPVRGGVTR